MEELRIISTVLEVMRSILLWIKWSPTHRACRVPSNRTAVETCRRDNGTYSRNLVSTVDRYLLLSNDIASEPSLLGTRYYLVLVTPRYTGVFVTVVFRLVIGTTLYKSLHVTWLLFINTFVVVSTKSIFVSMRSFYKSLLYSLPTYGTEHCLRDLQLHLLTVQLVSGL